GRAGRRRRRHAAHHHQGRPGRPLRGPGRRAGTAVHTRSEGRGRAPGRGGDGGRRRTAGQGFQRDHHRFSRAARLQRARLGRAGKGGDPHLPHHLRGGGGGKGGDGGPARARTEGSGAGRGGGPSDLQDREGGDDRRELRPLGRDSAHGAGAGGAGRRRGV